MSALPMNQSVILSGGYSPWQAPLAALFSGLSASGQPGGFSNFGAGVQQGAQQFLQGQQNQQAMQLRQMQMEQAQEEMRRANQEREQEQATLDRIKQSLARFSGSPAPTEVQPVGNYGAATGGIQTASGAPGGQLAAMFGGDQQKAALFSEYAEAKPVEAFQMLVEMGFAEPEAPKTTDGFQWDGDSWEPIPGYIEQQLQLKKAGAANTTVNVGPTGIDYGEPPKGLAWSRNPDGSVKLDDRGIPLAMPIQGTPEFLAQQQASNAAANRDAAAAQTTDIVTTDINRALEKIDEAIVPATGPVGGVAQHVPGTNAYDVKSLVQTIKGNIGIDKLQAMRMMSPTGGALGNVTEGELATLQATLGNLDQAQSRDQIEYNLKRVYNTYLDIVHGKGGGPARHDLGKEPAGPGSQAPKVGDVDGGYRFKGGNPADPSAWEKVN